MSAIFTQSYDTKENMMTLWYDQASNNSAGLSLRILVQGETCNITGEHFERGSSSEWKIFTGYWTSAAEFFMINEEFSDLWCLKNNLNSASQTARIFFASGGLLFL